MSDLLPCPFCGGKADIDYDGSVYDGTHVYCTECDIRTESYKTKTGSTWDVDAAIAAWNRRALPAAQPDPREAALRDIARQKKTDEMDTEYDVEYADFEGGYNAIIDVARVALRAVQPAHVNETPKSEHDTANMLTLTAERDRLAAAVDAVMADRKRILEERDRSFVMVMERAERAEAEVARLTALLPHPGETAAEVMWRNHQRGVRLEELAKAAGVTRERARQMVRKAEMRRGGA